ncbi:MAG: hypothetical protein Q9162_006137 [Coniocarpon cinnabarinum]
MTESQQDARVPLRASSNHDLPHADRRRRDALRPRERSLSDEAREQRRLRDRHLRQNFDSHEAWAESMQSRLGAAPPRTVRLSDQAQQYPHVDRTTVRQSLYDWSPADEEGDEEELEEILGELRDQQPNTHSDILRVLGRAQLEARQAQMEIERNRRSMGPPGPRPEYDSNQSSHQNSLRTAAILSSVRRNRQLSARSRDLMQRYVMDRERGEQTQGDASRDQRHPSTTASRMGSYGHEQHTNRYEVNRQAWQASQRPTSSTPHFGSGPTSSSETLSPHTTQNVPHIPRSAETLETLRRRYLEDPVARENQAVARFESAIRTLDALRDSEIDGGDFKELANQHALKQSEISGRREHVDVKNLRRIKVATTKPSFSSFLRKGVSFSGFQQAAPQVVHTVPQPPSAAMANTAQGTLLRSSDAGGRTMLYRISNSDGQAINAPNDSAATAAARAVWNGGRDGSSQRAWRESSREMGSNQGEGLRRRDSAHRLSNNPPVQDRWAVRVHLHNVDYESMSLQGTMEAFNMPSGSPTQLQYPTSSLRSTQRSSRAGNGTDGATTTARESSQPDSNIANHPEDPTSKTTTFSTYLEGELIDLDQHTLRTTTTNVSANATDDAKYWRRLAPFCSVRPLKRRNSADSGYDTSQEDDKEKHSNRKGGNDALLAAVALNPEWLQREWQEKYILMRWKELCFVPPTSLRLSSARSLSTPAPASSHGTQAPRSADDGLRRNPSGELEHRDPDGTAASTPSFGLSIKGFYYVSLRRADGCIEGLYFDPMSSPYQRLEMSVERGSNGGAPAVEWA